MASFRVYKKATGQFSVTATIRRGGVAISETFTATTKTKANSEAKLWAVKFENDLYLKKKNDPAAAKQSLSAFFAEYFDHLDLTHRKKPITVQNERYSMTQLVRLLGANTNLTDISISTMASYRDQRLREGVGASKIRVEFALISSLFKFAAQDRGFAVENPVGPGKLWRPPAPKGKIEFLSEDEIVRFLAECRKSRNPKLAAYVAVLLNTGMRPGEAAALRVRDVNQESRTIILEETKNGERRTVPMTDTAYREIMPLVTGRSRDEYIFHKGTILPPIYQKRPAQIFREPFDSAKRRAGLDRITRHGMRHTAATHMLAHGVSIRVIAAVLGHKTLQMVFRYTHPDDSELRKAVGVLDHLVD